MRDVVIVLATCSLLGCSSPANPRIDDAICERCARPEQPSSAPVITFIVTPSSITRAADGLYTFGFSLAYTDDDSGVHSVRIASDSFELETTLPLGAQLHPEGAAFTLPSSTTKGTLNFTLTVISSNGVASTPYTDATFLL